ncbi:MAG: class IV adenylate cyclase [Anaerolineae bacterium]|nr:class IV adenylate cyclase [Anaerolineae bacterium]
MMAQPGQYLEVEAKLWVDDLAPVLARLQASGAVLLQPRVLERNTRYEDASGGLTPAGIVLRLRQDSQARLTYKGPAQAPLTAGLQTRFEAEVAVSNFDTMAVILEKLGFTPFMVYEKHRTAYGLDGVQVLLDEMPFGHFVEVEGEPDRIEGVITRLGLAENPRFAESYAQLFDYVRAHLDLTCHDLTFENFAGIAVPFEAFRPPEG